MKVRYGGGRPVRVKGPATGTDYRFSGVERLQLVDPRDAIAIVRNPLFRIDGVVEVATTNVASPKRGRRADA
jgi:hypothetical protein